METASVSFVAKLERPVLKKSMTKLLVRMSLYENVLADLCARFVINSPQESFQSWERLLFEVTPTSTSG